MPTASPTANRSTATSPDDVSQGDTYGPVNYLAYVPFERIWPWSGTWNDLPAAHGAAVFFDLATFALLIFLGLRIRPGPEGRKLAATLAFGWAAYPYTAYALESNSNDTLVAMLLVATLLVLARPVAEARWRPWRRSPSSPPPCWCRCSLRIGPRVLSPQGTHRPLRSQSSSGAAPLRRHPRAFVCRCLRPAAVVVMLWPAIDPGLHTFYDRTIAYQAGRDSPFSIWGQVPGLEPLRIATPGGDGSSVRAPGLPTHAKDAWSRWPPWAPRC